MTLTNNEVLTHNDVTLGLQISTEMATAVELVTQIFANNLGRKGKYRHLL